MAKSAYWAQGTGSRRGRGLVIVHQAIETHISFLLSYSCNQLLRVSRYLRISQEELERLESAEVYLMSKGSRAVCRKVIRFGPSSQPTNIAAGWTIGPCHKEHLPLDAFHSALPPEPSTRIRQCTSKHSHAIINATGISVQDLLSDESVAVDFLSDVAGDGAAPLVTSVRDSRRW